MSPQTWIDASFLPGVTSWEEKVNWCIRKGSSSFYSSSFGSKPDFPELMKIKQLTIKKINWHRKSISRLSEIWIFVLITKNCSFLCCYLALSFFFAVGSILTFLIIWTCKHVYPRAPLIGNTDLHFLWID